MKKEQYAEGEMIQTEEKACEETDWLGSFKKQLTTRMNYAMNAGQWWEMGLEFTGGTSGRI